MASSDTPDASFGRPQSLRGYRLALLSVWFALSLGIAHADCALAFLPTGSLTSDAQIRAIEYSASAQPSGSGSVGLCCASFLVPNGVAQAAMASPAPGDDPGIFELAFATPHLVARSDDRRARDRLFPRSSRERRLYLRTSRLLI